MLPSCRARRAFLHVIRQRTLLSCLLLSSGALTANAGVPTETADKAQMAGKPTSLVIQPPFIMLAGPRSVQQIVVTGFYNEGPPRDLTAFCHMKPDKDGVVTLQPGGFVVPQSDGIIALIVEAGGCRASLPVVVRNFGRPEP